MGYPQEGGAPQEVVSPSAVGNMVVAALRLNTAFTRGFLDQKDVDMLGHPFL